MKIGITGAGGQLGMALVRHALARVPASNVVAITRNPGKLESYSQRGVQVRSGDFSQPSGLAAAFDGVERLVIIPTSDLQPGARRQQHTAAIEAAASCGVQHVIYISTVSARPDPQNELFDSHFATDQTLINSGLAWTLLRMSVYMETLLDGVKRAMAAGVYVAVPYRERRQRTSYATTLPPQQPVFSRLRGMRESPTMPPDPFRLARRKLPRSSQKSPASPLRLSR